MPYRVETFNSLFDSTEGDRPDDHDAMRLEVALNAAEQAGWTLVNHIPQYRVWDDEGQSLGNSDQLFVFHKAGTGTARLIN